MPLQREWCGTWYSVGILHWCTGAGDPSKARSDAKRTFDSTGLRSPAGEGLALSTDRKQFLSHRHRPLRDASSRCCEKRNRNGCRRHGPRKWIHFPGRAPNRTARIVFREASETEQNRNPPRAPTLPAKQPSGKGATTATYHPPPIHEPGRSSNRRPCMNRMGFDQVLRVVPEHAEGRQRRPEGHPAVALPRFQSTTGFPPTPATAKLRSKKPSEVCPFARVRYHLRLGRSRFRAWCCAHLAWKQTQTIVGSRQFGTVGTSVDGHGPRLSKEGKEELEKEREDCG